MQAEGACQGRQADPAGDRNIQRLGAADHRNRSYTVELTAHQGAQPAPLGTRDENGGKSGDGIGSENVDFALPIKPDPPESSLAKLVEGSRQVGHAQHGQVLDGARRGLHEGRRKVRRTIPRHHDPGDTRGLGGAQDGADIARIRDLVEGQEQRVVLRHQFLERERGRGLPGRDHPLVNHALGHSVEFRATSLPRPHSRLTRRSIEVCRQLSPKDDLAHGSGPIAQERSHRVRAGHHVALTAPGTRAIYTRRTTS